METTISVKTFGVNLRNRDKNQTDGKCSGLEFREKYLKDLEKADWWKGDNILLLDFEGVLTLSPGWANEAFSYFGRYSFISYEQFTSRVKINNLSKVKQQTITDELTRGFEG